MALDDWFVSVVEGELLTGILTGKFLVCLLGGLVYLVWREFGLEFVCLLVDNL